MTLDLSRYELAACLLARRNVSVVVDPTASRPWADHRSIHVLESDDEEVRRQVLAAASLIGAGVFDAPGWARSRPRTRDRVLAFEAGRARALVRGRYPGLAPDGAPDHVDAPTSADALRLARSGAVAPEVAWWWGELRPPAVPVPVEAAPEVHLVPPDAAVDEAQAAHDRGRSLGAVGRLLEHLGRSRRRGGGGSRSEGDGPGSTFTRSWGGRSGAGPGGWARTGADPTTTEVEREPGVHAYPEWDHRLARYRPRWCTVREVAPPCGPPTPPPPVDLRAALHHLGLALARVPRQPHGDDLDLDRCVDANIDLLSGVEPHPSWHVARLRRRRDLAVEVLVDVSDSTRDRAPDGRRIHEHQVEVARAVSGAIEELGGTTAVHAFRSRGRHDVELIRCKWFGRNPGDDLAGALAGLEPGARTRMGAAIRHGAEVLRRHGGASLRMLVVITDGFAHDDGYEGPHGREDARRALLEARRAGIASLCLSVGSPLVPTELSEVFGTTAHAHAEDLAGLRGDLRHVTSSAVADAERIRRRHTKERLRG